MNLFKKTGLILLVSFFSQTSFAEDISQENALYAQAIDNALVMSALLKRGMFDSLNNQPELQPIKECIAEQMAKNAQYFTIAVINKSLTAKELKKGGMLAQHPVFTKTAQYIYEHNDELSDEAAQKHQKANLYSLSVMPQKLDISAEEQKQISRFVSWYQKFNEVILGTFGANIDTFLGMNAESLSMCKAQKQ